MNENQTFGWDPHQHDENSHENDPLNFRLKPSIEEMGKVVIFLFIFSLRKINKTLDIKAIINEMDNEIENGVDSEIF